MTSHTSTRWSRNGRTSACVPSQATAIRSASVASRRPVSPAGRKSRTRSAWLRGPVAILYTRDEFRAFLDGAKKGEFDHLV
jgi:hypothetical protein